MLSRRELIKLGLYGGGAALLHLSTSEGRLAWALDSVTNLPPSPASKPFQVPLPVPPVHQSVDPKTLQNIPTFNDNFGTTYYDVTMQEGTASILPGQKTVIWGYNGHYPGPTFSARLDNRIVVRQHNNLPVNTIVHRHGGHNPSDSDGSALFTEQIAPGTFRDFLYINDDDVGATNWYHDHDIDFTGHNVYMGLAGFYLLDDNVEDAFNLPGAAGDNPPNAGDYPFEMALVFQDRVFDANNQLVYNPFDHDGFLGDTFLVNGAIQPVMKVYNRKYRFHVLNGSNARFYQLALSNPNLAFQVIASEGGFLAKRVEVSDFRLGMGERLEFIMDFSSIKPGTSVVMNNIMQQSNGRGPDGVDPRSPTPLMRFDVQALPTGVTDRSSNPVTLRTDLPVFDPAKATQTVNLEFNRSDGAWQVNGRFFDPTRTDFTIKLNTTVIFNFKNGGGGWFHPIHLHRNEFFILARNGKPPGPLERGLKDIAVLAGGEEARVVTRFSDARVATATRPAAPTTRALGKYVLHCHNIEHEDMRMMVVFNVEE